MPLEVLGDRSGRTGFEMRISRKMSVLSLTTYVGILLTPLSLSHSLLHNLPLYLSPALSLLRSVLLYVGTLLLLCGYSWFLPMLQGIGY